MKNDHTKREKDTSPNRMKKKDPQMSKDLRSGQAKNLTPSANLKKQKESIKNSK